MEETQHMVMMKKKLSIAEHCNYLKFLATWVFLDLNVRKHAEDVVLLLLLKIGCNQSTPGWKTASW